MSAIIRKRRKHQNQIPVTPSKDLPNSTEVWESASRQQREKLTSHHAGEDAAERSHLSPCPGSCIQWLFPRKCPWVLAACINLSWSWRDCLAPEGPHRLAETSVATALQFRFFCLTLLSSFLPKSIVQWAPGMEISASEWVTREMQPTSVAAQVTETTDSKMGVRG